MQDWPDKSKDMLGVVFEKGSSSVRITANIKLWKEKVKEREQ